MFDSVEVHLVVVRIKRTLIGLRVTVDQLFWADSDSFEFRQCAGSCNVSGQRCHLDVNWMPVREGPPLFDLEPKFLESATRELDLAPEKRIPC
jgi:hypothetical protein